MGTESRKEQIEAMLADDPDDLFLRYSLAMELAKEGDHDRSLQTLQQLMQGVPPHVPSFFMAGQQLTKLGRLPEARSVLREGIEQARTQGDQHAVSEMSEFLVSLGALGE